MRRTCLNLVHDMARTDERVIFIGSDVGVGTLDDFRKEIPERFFMEGISEQHIIGMSAGLAMEGNIPYVNTIAVFITRRCFEQVALDLCLHNLNVRLIGNGGGLVYGPLGPTHLAVEDIAIMRTLPGMTILAPCDSQEMQRLMPLTLDYQGPIYIRLAKGGDKIVSSGDKPLEIGKGVNVTDGEDVLIITTGVMLQPALEAAGILQSDGISVGITHLHTIKPLDSKTILERCQKVRVVVSVEEGTILGGLGGALAEIIAEANFDPAKKFRRMGLPDMFSERYGNQNELLADSGLTAQNIANTVSKLMEQ